MSVSEIRAFEIAPGYDGFATLAPNGGTVGLLLLPEMFGVTTAMEEAARQFARDGVTTLVPNLFWRSKDTGPLTYDGADRERAQNRADDLEPGAVCEDVERAIKALRTRVPTLKHVAALGHCIGGTFAVTALPRTSLAAAASYYGFHISTLGDAFAKLEKPAQLHYGLEDPHVPAGEIDAVKVLARGNPHISIFEYPGAAHSFCNVNRPMYDKTQARTAHERTLALLRGLK